MRGQRQGPQPWLLSTEAPGETEMPDARAALHTKQSRTMEMGPSLSHFFLISASAVLESSHMGRSLQYLAGEKGPGG